MALFGGGDAFGKVVGSGKGMISSSILYKRAEHTRGRPLNMAAVGTHAFNPFANRNKNTRVKWFNQDLESFYAFVETQPLLTSEQELQYGKALKMWVNIEKKREELHGVLELSEDAKVSNAELALSVGCSELTLEKMRRYAEVSKTKLVDCNLKLVLAVVSRYRSSQIPNAELIAEGIRGLARASLRYDYSKGFRFATYATWYVHQAVVDYVRWRKHPAKMPSRYLLLQRKVKQFSADYNEDNGRLPTVSEISEALGNSHFDVVKVLSMQQYPLLMHSPMSGRNSLLIKDGRDRSFEEMLPSKSMTAETSSQQKDLRSDMEKMMQFNLNDVERDVLRLRLGLDDGRVKPVKEVGKRFKISWKQVRNVEREAISKLKSSAEISDFVQSYNID
jgi:RNA polymerase sigma factor (sigma-70 family)